MSSQKGEKILLFEFSAEMAEEIERAEADNISFRFYNLNTRCYQGIHTCEGDVTVICNALADYADALMEYIRQEGDAAFGYKKAFYEIYAERCRKISKKLQGQIGYDRDAAIERCQAKKKYYSSGYDDADQNDIGEDGLSLFVKKTREKRTEGNGHEGSENGTRQPDTSEEE